MDSMQKLRLVIVLAVMAGFMIFGFFKLGDQAVVGKALTTSHPTAYIEGNQVKASFKLDGRISELLVDEGEVVTKGQVLGTLQNDELEAKVTQAQAAVAVVDGKISEAMGAQLTAEAKKAQGNDAVMVTEETADKQIAQAQAAVKAANAKLEAVQNGARTEEIKQAESQMNATEEIQKVAKDNWEKLKKLLEAGAVSQADVDKAYVSYQEAKAKYEVAKEQYQLAVNGSREEEIKAAKAQVEQAQAAYELAVAAKQEVLIRQGDVKTAEAGIQQAKGAVETAQSTKSQAEAALAEANVYLSYTNLVAPADGTIKTKSAEAGELVGSGFPVFTLETNEARWSKFYFPETEIIGLQVGDRVQLKLVATGKQLKGTIVSIAPAADFAIQKATQNMNDKDIRSFAVKVQYDELSSEIKTGMTVEWQAKLGDKDGD